jgi:hypothetical protein
MATSLGFPQLELQKMFKIFLKNSSRDERKYGCSSGTVITAPLIANRL